MGVAGRDRAKHLVLFRMVTVSHPPYLLGTYQTRKMFPGFFGKEITLGEALPSLFLGIYSSGPLNGGGKEISNKGISNF